MAAGDGIPSEVAERTTVSETSLTFFFFFLTGKESESAPTGAMTVAFVRIEGATLAGAGSILAGGIGEAVTTPMSLVALAALLIFFFPNFGGTLPTSLIALARSLGSLTTLTTFFGMSSSSESSSTRLVLPITRPAPPTTPPDRCAAKTFRSVLVSHFVGLLGSSELFSFLLNNDANPPKNDPRRFLSPPPIELVSLFARLLNLPPPPIDDGGAS